MQMKIQLLLAVVVLAASACLPFQSDQPLSEMELRREKGTVEVLREGERIVVDDVLSLQPSDVIHTGEDSAARLRLQGDRIAEMVSNGRTRVVDAHTLENQSGRLLARAAQAMEIRFGDVTVSGEGSLFRIDRGVATTRTGVYRGDITMSSPGEPRLDVHQLFQTTVTADDLPNETKPYRLQLDDPWDLVFLQSIVSLEEELDQLARGLRAQLGDRKPTPRYFKDLSGRRDVDFIKPYLGQPAEDLLVGFALASNDDQPLGRAFRQAFVLYRDGGSWGVAAGIMDVRPRLLIADLEDIILATGIVDTAGGGSAIFVVAGGALGSGRRPPATGGDPTGPSPQDPGRPTSGPSPSPQCDIECEVAPIPTLPTPMPTQDPNTNGGGSPKPKPSPSGSSDDDGLLDVIGGIIDFAR